MALLITFLAGLTIAAGSFVMLFSKKPHRVEHISIALALGALLSLMIFDLGPDVAGASEAFPAWMLLIFVAAGVGVLKLLVSGMNAKQIAAQLSISKNTVDTHRRRIMDKVGCNSMAELTRYAIREGYLDLV